MSAAPPPVEVQHSAQVPRLLVELPSRPRVFLGNLRDLLFPRRLSPLELHSTPAPFWPDVFVYRKLPWDRFLQSGLYHLIAGGIAVGLGHLFALQPRVVEPASFDHSQIIYYQPSEYLPPIDTRSAPKEPVARADPEFSRQPIISVPREADNRSQTIVTPPRVKLKHDLAMPNIVAWSDAQQKPRLYIPPAPMTPAAQITRLAPSLDASVAAPPDASYLAHQRSSPTLQSAVVTPPAELNAANASAAFPALQPRIAAPPESVENISTRTLGDLNIAPSAVIAPAPQLPVAAQRSLSRGRIGLAAPAVVAPPASVSQAGSAGTSVGSRGRVVALSLQPSVTAPSTPPAGNRRGTFAATPDGHAGASGAPGSVSAGASARKESTKGSTRKETNLPAGLYVGGATSPPASGELAKGAPSSTAANPDLVASVHGPRVSSTRPLQPESATKLSEPERAVFGGRRFYSVTLSMPNFNSVGGSWVIRFAELNRDSGPHAAAAPSADLSQPTATRKVDPAYPIQLMKENVSGTVILYAVIHADGKIGDIRVLRSVDPRLDRYASDAVAQWQFEPATKNGSPVDVEATFQIPFRPSRLGTNF